MWPPTPVASQSVHVNAVADPTTPRTPDNANANATNTAVSIVWERPEPVCGRADGKHQWYRELSALMHWLNWSCTLPDDRATETWPPDPLPASLSRGGGSPNEAPRCGHDCCTTDAVGACPALLTMLALCTHALGRSGGCALSVTAAFEPTGPLSSKPVLWADNGSLRAAGHVVRPHPFGHDRDAPR